MNFKKIFAIVVCGGIIIWFLLTNINAWSDRNQVLDAYLCTTGVILKYSKVGSANSKYLTYHIK